MDTSLNINADEAKNAPAADLMAKLFSSRNGLSSSDAIERLQKYGPNEIAQKKVNPLIKFLGYSGGPFPG